MKLFSLFSEKKLYRVKSKVEDFKYKNQLINGITEISWFNPDRNEPVIPYHKSIKDFMFLRKDEINKAYKDFIEKSENLYYNRDRLIMNQCFSQVSKLEDEARNAKKKYENYKKANPKDIAKKEWKFKFFLQEIDEYFSLTESDILLEFLNEHLEGNHYKEAIEVPYKLLRRTLKDHVLIDNDLETEHKKHFERFYQNNKTNLNAKPSSPEDWAEYDYWEFEYELQRPTCFIYDLTQYDKYNLKFNTHGFFINKYKFKLDTL